TPSRGFPSIPVGRGFPDRIATLANLKRARHSRRSPPCSTARKDSRRAVQSYSEAPQATYCGGRCGCRVIFCCPLPPESADWSFYHSDYYEKNLSFAALKQHFYRCDGPFCQHRK